MSTKQAKLNLSNILNGTAFMPLLTKFVTFFAIFCQAVAHSHKWNGKESTVNRALGGSTYPS
jgi:hypothetical protein